MSNSAPIAFIDSGIGGLPYLQWVKERLPFENFVYLADRKNFPYGEKSSDEIVEIVLRAVKSLRAGSYPKMLVIACNTATVTSLDAVRAAVDFPVVGVVPAVKPAASSSRNKRIGVMATKRTIDGSYLQRLIENFAPDCHVEKVAASGVVSFVENDFFMASDDQKMEIVENAVDLFSGEKVDKVVLGCTHFIYLDEILRKRLGEAVEIIDSRDGVGRQIIHVLEKENLLSREKREDIFYCSAESPGDSYRQFAAMFGLSYGGVMEGL
ncbi:MAG: glutamate racemase [Spirochaetales bacterium]|nr:glutamate racemase [Spirochaetales bacterium]